jgi:drug/metabolite transporter (DMT)-like permease
MKVINKTCGLSDSNQVLLYRSLVISLISVLILRSEKKTLPSYGNVGSIFWFTIRNVTGYICNIALILCLNYIRLSTALVFNALSPVFTCIFSVVIIKEKFYPRYILGIIVCFTGCLIMIMNDRTSGSKPNIESLNNTTVIDEIKDNSNINSQELQDSQLMNTLIGCFFGIIHTLFLSLHQTSTKILLNHKIENNVLIFYLGLTNGVLSYLTWQFIRTHEEMWWSPCFVFQQLFNGGIYFTFVYLINIGYKNLDLIQTAGLGYITIVESFILGALFLGESVYFSDIIGSLIIVVYNVLNSYFPIKP